MAETVKREPELDLLRLVCLLAVMALHVCSSVWGEIPLFTPAWGFATALRQTWAVPVLVMITGCLLLPGTGPVGKPIRRIAVHYPVWALVYQLYYLCRGGLDWKGFLAGCVTGAYHMWYLWMLLGLYALTPVLRPIAGDRRLCGYFLRLYAAVGAVTYLLPELPLLGVTLGKAGDMLHVSFGYSGLYLLGHYLKRWPPRERRVYALGILCWVISRIGNAMLTRKTGGNSEFFTAYLSPTMLPVAGAVFLLFTRRMACVRWKAPTRQRLRRLGELSLNAYLSHALVNEAVVALVGKQRLAAQPVWMLPAVILVALGSFGIAWLLERGGICGHRFCDRLGGRV